MHKIQAHRHGKKIPTTSCVRHADNHYFLNIHGHYFGASQQNTTFFTPVDHFTIADEQNF